MASGFRVENRQRLLEPYMTTREKGTGLGLAIVKKIMEDHGGGIELLDAPEEGASEEKGGGRGAMVRLTMSTGRGAADTSADEESAPTQTVATDGV